MSQNELTAKIHELRELRRMADELAAEIDGITDTIKQHMDAAQMDTLTGSDWKVTYFSSFKQHWTTRPDGTPGDCLRPSANQAAFMRWRRCPHDHSFHSRLARHGDMGLRKEKLTQAALQRCRAVFLLRACPDMARRPKGPHSATQRL